MKMILEMILSKLDTWLFKKQQVLLIDNDEYWLFYQNCYPKKERKPKFFQFSGLIYIKSFNKADSIGDRHQGKTPEYTNAHPSG
jgi:hypothetical protein